MPADVSPFTDRKLFFMHNPKAGGTAVRRAFEACFPACARAPVFANAPNDAARWQDNLAALEGFSFYSGHYGYNIYRRLAAKHLLITNFRYPVSRILSLYNYWRNSVSTEHLKPLHPDDAACVLEAKNKSFSDFIRSPNPHVQLYICDAHFRQLYWSNWSMDRGSPFSILVVKRRIARAHWFYVTEFPAKSEQFLRRAFPDLQLPPIGTDNVSFRSERDISARDTQYLEDLNPRDLLIYRFAVRRLVRETAVPSVRA